MTLLSETELEAFRRGDELLFRTLVETISPRMLALVRPYARDPDEAHDIVQDAWHQAYTRRRSFRGEGSVVGWLLGIARNCARMRLRRRRTRCEVDELDASVEPHDVATSMTLLDALAALPERERDTVVLRLLYGCTTRETATRLGCAEGTVKAALHHALEKLRPLLKERLP